MGARIQKSGGTILQRRDPFPQSRRVPVTIRPAVAGDLAFVDSLQKKHTHAVGWMPTKQLEGKIAAGNVLVAEEMRNAECGMLNAEC